MSSFWLKEIQLIVNAWLCLEERWIHSKDLPAFFEIRNIKRMWPESGLADKNHRDYGIERKFWSVLAGLKDPIGDPPLEHPYQNDVILASAR